MREQDEAFYAGLRLELEKGAASKALLSVAKGRRGRRSMSVDTLVKKHKEGTLFKHAWSDQLPGGLADKKQPTDFSSAALAKGRSVEREHTKHPRLATEIAMDHLAEDSAYYEKLEQVEKKAGFIDVLKTPIPGTKDWFIRTGKQSLQGAGRVARRAPQLAGGTRSSGGVTSIDARELARLGFGDLTKRAFALQGHVNYQGLSIDIENRKGSVRSGVDKDGKPWRTKFKYPYGYIKHTEGKDGEEIDAYVGPDKKAPKAFVVHQRHIDGTGHDEDKVMLGFKSEDDARKAYLEHYNKVGPKLLGPISTITVDELKQKLEEKRKHTKLAFGGLTGSSLAPIDRDDQPERTKPGDVPSRDGASPGAVRVEKTEHGLNSATVLPTGATIGTPSTVRL